MVLFKQGIVIYHRTIVISPIEDRSTEGQIFQCFYGEILQVLFYNVFKPTEPKHIHLWLGFDSIII